MPKNSISKASDLNGLFIYQDPKKGTVYYDIFSKKGYVLTSSDVKKYVLYSSSLFIGLVAAALAYALFNTGIVPAALIFVVVYVILEIIFRVSFLYKLPKAENWKPFKKDSIFVAIAKMYSTTRLAILIGLLILITILMPVYANMAQMDNVNKYGSYIIAAATGIYAIINIIALIQKKQNNY